jgi:ubiquinol-cytochrome c reductase cytochrome b subunit
MRLDFDRGAAGYLDDRLGTARLLRRNYRKVFPDHWSFLLGELALYCFIILILTGIFLTFWFNPSMAETTYTGSYAPLFGLSMSEAYASTLHITFDVRGGLLMRQIHHWAALVFVAAISIHMLRVFFTGAFRRPREINWLIGVTLFLLAILEGFAGYSLPDDLLSGTGLRIADGVVLSIPLVGTWLSFLLFGGEYPGEILITRLFTLHILLVPGLMLALIAAHLTLVWVQKHTQQRGPGRTEHNVVGTPVYPSFAVKSTALLVFVGAVLAGLGAFAQINPVWLYGPYNPAQVSASSQPDWYIGFLEGSLRLMPGVETAALGYTVAWNVLIPAVLYPLVLFGVLAVYPFLERRFTKDRRAHHLVDRVRDAPTRAGIGAAGITAFTVTLVAGANDVISVVFRIPLFWTTYALRTLFVLGPIIAFFAVRRICIELQRRDREALDHGVETGVIRRAPDGSYSEVSVPLQRDRREELLPPPGRDERPAEAAPSQAAAGGPHQGSRRR